ncbi:hypothetical protein CQ10_00570 [Bradyrhizobium valentinum]|nr:hypothetical protein CQ10_00570 [Bradyrhizobium valentinum]
MDKLLANKREAIRLRMARMQVEAVVKMLQPGCNVASIAARSAATRCSSGILFRSAVDVIRRHPDDGAGNRRRPNSRQGS